MDTAISKETLLSHVDALRDLSRRSRHVASAMTLESEKQRLQRHVMELDESANRLEILAVEAKTAVFSQSRIIKPSRWGS